MMGFIANLFARPAPSVTEARPSDAANLAALHGMSFNRGWSEDEFERLLVDRAVVAHRVRIGQRLVGFIISRIVAGEAEILSVAVASARRGKGLARQMLNLHLRRLAGLGTRTSFSRSMKAMCRPIGSISGRAFAPSAAARPIIRTVSTRTGTTVFPVRPARAPPPWCCVATCLDEPGGRAAMPPFLFRAKAAKTGRPRGQPRGKAEFSSPSEG